MPKVRVCLLKLTLIFNSNCRVIATTRNKPQQKFCEFIKPYLDQLQDLHITSSDFEQLKIIGRGAFGQVALVKVHYNSCFESKSLCSLSVDIDDLILSLSSSNNVGEREWQCIRHENIKQARNAQTS